MVLAATSITTALNCRVDVWAAENITNAGAIVTLHPVVVPVAVSDSATYDRNVWPPRTYVARSPASSIASLPPMYGLAANGGSGSGGASMARASPPPPAASGNEPGLPQPINVRPTIPAIFI